MREDYGKELVLDLHGCYSFKFNRKHLKKFFVELCDVIDMEPAKLTWWDDLYTPVKFRETEKHLVGTSAVQFIKTSNITIHTIEHEQKVYLNIFSCKKFNEIVARDFVKEFFGGELVNMYVLRRV